MNQSRRDRTLAFKTLKHTSNTRQKWHYHALKFMMNKVLTRDWICRMQDKTKKNKNGTTS